MGFRSEFWEFLKEYRVLGLAVAFVMGVATNDLVNSLVNNIIMPVIAIFIPTGEWETATLELGPVIIGWGSFLAELINFTIIALIVFLIVKKVMKRKKASKK